MLLEIEDVNGAVLAKGAVRLKSIGGCVVEYECDPLPIIKYGKASTAYLTLDVFRIPYEVSETEGHNVFCVDSVNLEDGERLNIVELKFTLPNP